MKEVGQVHQFAHDTTQISIEDLMDEYGNEVYKIAYVYVKDKHMAEDIFQEVFYKVMKSYHQFREDSHIKTWIIRITINTCKDYLRSSWLRRVTLTEKYEESTDVIMPSDFIKQEENQVLYDAIYKLPSKYKEVVILYYFKEYSYEEISEVLRIPKGTVQSRLSRAKLKLKQLLINEVIN